MTEPWVNNLKDSHKHNNHSFPELITNHFINKIEASSALKKQFMVSADEIEVQGGLKDPIGDEKHSPVPGLIHRYKNRALFVPTLTCPVHCRYCFRKNELNNTQDFLKNDFNQVLEYIKSHSEINEIIFTGGDPLMLSDKKIQFYLESFSKIESIRFIRFHTRTPIVLPSRITRNFTELIKDFEKRFVIHLVMHINHLDEWSYEFDIALKTMSEYSIKLLSQTVLLKDINDNFEDLFKLFEKMAESGIRPYYLHHPDQVKGAMHFYVTIKEGRKIYAQLRDCLPGWALPSYVIDIPHGPGKAPLFNSESFDFSGKLIDRHGRFQIFKEPIT